MDNFGLSILICCLFLQIHVILGDNKWNIFKVRLTQNKVGQWEIPLTATKADKAGYKKATNHEEFDMINVHCRDNDPRGCPMYDSKGKLCGFRIGYVINTLSGKCQIDSYYPYKSIKIFQKGKIFTNIDYYYVDFIFSTPESLRTGGPKSRTDPVGDSLHVKLDGKTWTEIPKREKDMKLPGIVKQACNNRLGQHYFFIDKNTNCAKANPFFAMYHEGDLVGFGMVTFGYVSKTTQDWYEQITSSSTNAKFVSPPACLATTIDQCGGIGMHMFFTEKPQDITCPETKTKNRRTKKGK